MKFNPYNIILGLLLCLSVKTVAQLQTAHWYFGGNAGIDFTSGTPVADTNGQISTNEGCTSISDEYGNLLFYSDGQTVYDSNHNMMPNGTGLGGHRSSTQSSIALPKPDDCNLYYLFTINLRVGEILPHPYRGIEYSVVDMTLNGGLGDIIPDQKNIPVLINGEPVGYEKLTAVSNANNTGYWVITHYEGNFYAFAVTEDGINLTPVISPSLGIYGGFTNVGYLKVSPDGSKLAMAMGSIINTGSLSLYDFDNETGIVSNEVILENPGIYDFYGVEFSPNSKILYATMGDDGFQAYDYSILQFNLEASSVGNSRYEVMTSNGHMGALQIALDNKVYYSPRDSYYLARIENPDTAYNPDTGESPVYTEEAVYLGGERTRYGLPQFLNFYFRINLLINGLTNAGTYCVNQHLSFDFCSQGGEINGVHWDFGDGNTSTETYPIHIYTEPGNYIITLTLIVGETEYTREFEIEIAGPITEDATLSKCITGEEYTFILTEAYPQINPNEENVTISFHETQEHAENNEYPIIPEEYSISTNIILWVRVVDETGCYVVVQLKLIISPIPTLVVQEQEAICEGNSTVLYTVTDSNSVNWYDSEEAEIPFFTGETYTTEELYETTSYWVEAENTEGCTSERQEIVVMVNPLAELLIEDPNPQICSGENITLTAGSVENTVNWYFTEESETPDFTGEIFVTPNLTETTTYWVEAVSEEECVSERQAIIVTVNPLPELTIEDDEVEICYGETAALSVVTNGETVNWYESATSEIIIDSGSTITTLPLFETTIFWVEALTGDCPSDRLPVEVTVIPTLELETVQPNEICVGETATLTVVTNGDTINWYETDTSEITLYSGNDYQTDELIETTTFWVEAVTGDCKSGRLPVTVTVIPTPDLETVQPHEICAGETAMLTVVSNGEAINWYETDTSEIVIYSGNDFQTTPLFETTTFWVEALTGDCLSGRSPVTVPVIPTPELETVQPNEICAGETAVLSVVTNGQTINWYQTNTSETILFEGNDYETIPLFETTTFWVEAITGDCSTIRESVTVTVNPMPDVLSEDTILWCDSLNDGEEPIDLTQNNIIISNNPEVILTYYRTPEDLENEQSPIDDPANFPINSSQGVVYVSAAAGDCKVEVQLTIILTEAPAVSDTSLEICSPNGTGTYELTDANGQIIDDPQDYTITYHLNYEQALNGINPLPETYNALTSQTIFARVEKLNDSDCFNIAEIELTYNNTFDTITPLEECDDNNDGLATFDLTEKEPEISAVFGGSGYILIFYTSLENAYDNVSEIPNPENYINQSNPQTVYAKVYDDDICLGIVSFDVIVVQIPQIEIEKEITLCPGDEYPIEAEPGYESYTWTNPNGTFISTTNSAVLDTEGTYILEITFADNICVFREEIEVEFDDFPVITNIEVNGSTVTVTATGTPPLEYSLDSGQTWQSSNVFYEVPYGEYEIKVRNTTGCESDLYPVIVFELTNIITPNGDGYNDTWEIPALVNYPGATLKIVDRYGKTLVDTSLENGFSWDGKHNRNPLPSTSYWYVLDLGNGQKMTGNVTIKNY